MAQLRVGVAIHCLMKVYWYQGENREHYSKSAESRSTPLELKIGIESLPLLISKMVEILNVDTSNVVRLEDTNTVTVAKSPEQRSTTTAACCNGPHCWRDSEISTSLVLVPSLPPNGHSDAKKDSLLC